MSYRYTEFSLPISRSAYSHAIKKVLANYFVSAAQRHYQSPNSSSLSWPLFAVSWYRSEVQFLFMTLIIDTTASQSLQQSPVATGYEMSGADRMQHNGPAIMQ